MRDLYIDYLVKHTGWDPIYQSCSNELLHDLVKEVMDLLAEHETKMKALTVHFKETHQLN